MGATSVVPDLTGLVVDTHRPQNTVKKVIPSKVSRVVKDKKKVRFEYNLSASNSRSKATNLDGLDSHTLIMHKGVRVTLTNNEEKTVVKEVELSIFIYAFLEFHSRTLMYRYRISSLLRKELSDEGNTKAIKELVDLKKMYEANQKLWA
ncbi:hypothetical protein V8G54_003544 [Vigna mungo]|uniref:Uncharacterized protein n=1 Tax=Vigna mungo TaxID=3915 RepID=A0AAQ3PCB4_VIGMU